MRLRLSQFIAVEESDTELPQNEKNTGLAGKKDTAEPCTNTLRGKGQGIRKARSKSVRHCIPADGVVSILHLHGCTRSGTRTNRSAYWLFAFALICGQRLQKNGWPTWAGFCICFQVVRSIGTVLTRRPYKLLWGPVNIGLNAIWRRTMGFNFPRWSGCLVLCFNDLAMTTE